MRWPPRNVLVCLTLALLFAVSVGRPSFAAPPAHAPAPRAAPPAAPAPLPDYGGRDSALGGALDATENAPTMSPLAQVGKALEALVIVLALVVGGLYGAKRIGLIKGDGQVPSSGGMWSGMLSRASRPTGGTSDASPSDLITVLSSQMLPQGGGLHLVAIGGRTLLLGATPQSVTLLTELEAEDLFAAAADETETPAERAAFAAYLQKEGVTPPPASPAEAAQETLSSATERLQSLLSRGRQDG